MKTQKFSLALLTLSVSLTSLSAELPSPVGLIDLGGYVRAGQAYREQKDARAFSDFVAILYDSAIGRPWGDSYWPEADRRWQAVYAQLCPAIALVCNLPSGFRAPEDFQAVNSALVRPEVQQALDDHFNGVTSAVVRRVRYLTEDQMAPVSWMVASRVVESTEKDVHFWDLASAEIHHQDLEFVQLDDLKSYAPSSVGLAPNYIFFQHDHPEVLLANVDAIKNQAVDFATKWSSDVHHPRVDPPLLFFDRVVGNQLVAKYSDRFAQIYDRLLKSLAQLPEGQVKDVRQRFEKERSLGLYPSEVFQFVAYDLIHQMLTVQGDYFVLSEPKRVGTSDEIRAWESYLTVQAYADPKFLMYSMILEGLNPGTTVLNQFTSSSTVLKYLYEQLSVVLELGPYQNFGKFDVYGDTLRNPDLFDKDYLAAQRPDLLKELTDPQSGQLKDVFAMEPVARKQILRKYLIGDDGKVVVASLFRLAQVYTLNVSDPDAADIAKLIHTVRAEKFWPKAVN